ncbi:ATP-binding protein [Bacillus sp. JCM 19034]|uniref:ATP-binding protein n=1 Tax=Bacillus sp. JCM 19034 TaxID=1481928 RepID=UPI001E599831|nr:ATP-binding protein [Bacillus sp. JCM 19034]
MANSITFSKVDLQKVIVSVSELTHNILDHAGGLGEFSCEYISDKGLKITVQDYGTGIKEIDKILNGDPNFNRKGLGLGLLGAKRLMDDLKIDTSERGTTIIAIKWKSS